MEGFFSELAGSLAKRVRSYNMAEAAVAIASCNLAVGFVGPAKARLRPQRRGQRLGRGERQARGSCLQEVQRLVGAQLKISRPSLPTVGSVTKAKEVPFNIMVAIESCLTVGQHYCYIDASQAKFGQLLEVSDSDPSRVKVNDFLGVGKDTLKAAQVCTAAQIGRAHGLNSSHSQQSRMPSSA